MIDYIILASSLVIALAFMLLGVHRVFNFYVGVIVGFLVFLALNIEIKLLLVSEMSKLSGVELTIFNAKENFLSWSIFIIPVLGVLFSVFTPKSKKSFLVSALFGFLIPFFFVGLMAFIWKTSSVKISFINYVSNIFIDSRIFDFFFENITLFFIFTTFLLFGKFFYYIGKIFLYFLIWASKSFTNWLLKTRKKQEN
ncbi:MAG: hypothetical protein PHH06_01130 [Candidatus Gracilibacteria bacterium]|nr:hypothetical protein [Candidatus Gracilibacteria bacterium]